MRSYSLMSHQCGLFLHFCRGRDTRSSTSLRTFGSGRGSSERFRSPMATRGRPTNERTNPPGRRESPIGSRARNAYPPGGNIVVREEEDEGGDASALTQFSTMNAVTDTATGARIDNRVSSHHHVVQRIPPSPFREGGITASETITADPPVPVPSPPPSPSHIAPRSPRAPSRSPKFRA